MWSIPFSSRQATQYILHAERAILYAEVTFPDTSSLSPFVREHLPRSLLSSQLSPPSLYHKQLAELFLLLHVCGCLSGVDINPDPVAPVGCAPCGLASTSLASYFSQLLHCSRSAFWDLTVIQGSRASLVCDELSPLCFRRPPVLPVRPSPVILLKQELKGKESK